MNLMLKKIQKVVNLSYIIISLIACMGYSVSMSEALKAEKLNNLIMRAEDSYHEIRRIIAVSLIGQLFCPLLLLLLINRYLTQGAARLISKAEEEGFMYREYALKDQLTGAYSRLFYESKDSQNRYRFMSDMCEPLTVIMIDIDSFKYINDTYGHMAGDRVLKHIAHVIQDNITEKDRLIRYGGDEFLLILSSCDEAKLNGLMTKIQMSINNEIVKTPLSLSYGIYRMKAGDNLETAIKEADIRMYAKKKLKKNNI